VPFLLKDFGALYAGVRMASGYAFMGEFVPDHDSDLVKRFKHSWLFYYRKDQYLSDPITEKCLADG
jgi:hypothetical protein